MSGYRQVTKSRGREEEIKGISLVDLSEPYSARVGIPR